MDREGVKRWVECRDRGVVVDEIVVDSIAGFSVLDEVFISRVSVPAPGECFNIFSEMGITEIMIWLVPGIS